MNDHRVPVMVQFRLPSNWPEELAAIIPQQRAIVNRLLAEGTIQSYSVSSDRTTVWMVIVVEDRPGSVEDLIDEFPIVDFGSYTYENLLFTNDSSSIMHYSLN